MPNGRDSCIAMPGQDNRIEAELTGELNTALDRVDRPAGHPGGDEVAEPVSCRAARQLLDQQWPELIAVGRPAIVAGEPGVRGQVRHAKDIADPGELRVIGRDDDQVAIAARLTFLSAPDSVQGALAAGLLGGGSRFLGVTEDPGRFLADVLAQAGDPLPADDSGWDALALAAVRRASEAGRFVPGLGHPTHKVTDPRTPVLIAIAQSEGLRGPHLRL